MSSLDSADLAHIWDKANRCLSDLTDSRIFITGGTGFFGCWLLESLSYAIEHLGLTTEVTVLTRNANAFLDKMPHFKSANWLRCLEGDVKSFQLPPEKFTHVIHGATEASAKLNQENPILMLDTITQGTRQVLEQVAHLNLKQFLFISSGAVYGRQPPELNHISESYIGTTDPLQSGSAYSVGKLYAEHLSMLFAKQYGLPVKIARCFAFVGPYLPLSIHFAIGNFIQHAIKREAIKINGDGSPYRSYLYAADLVIWLWMILCEGQVGRAYNVGSEQAVSIAELAHLISQGTLDVTIAKERQANILPERYVPDTKRAQQELNLRQWISLPEAIAKTIQWSSTYAKSQ
jgi:nucleoside-diphosphate-sugar epimerase